MGRLKSGVQTRGLLAGLTATACSALLISPMASRAQPAPDMLTVGVGDLSALDWGESIGPMRPDVRATYGTYGSQIAVPDMRAAFSAASGSADHRHRFVFGPNDRSDEGLTPDAYAVADHIQTFARLSGRKYATYFLLARSARDIGDGAIYVAHFDSFTSNGQSWKFAARDAEVPEAKRYSYYRMPGLNHAGGAQVLGQLAFVAGDCDSGHLCPAYVGIYDLRGVPDGEEIREIGRVWIDARSGALGPDQRAMDGRQVTSRAAAVAAIRLEDGRYLLFVPGRQDDETGWFFVSTGTDIEATGWVLADFWRRDDLPEGTPWEPWETVNFVAESSGRLFMWALGTGDNKCFLYEVVIGEGPDPQLTFRYVAGRGLNTFPGNVSARWGAGAYVTPEGKITTYVTGRGQNIADNLKLNEFRSRDEVPSRINWAN